MITRQLMSRLCIAAALFYGSPLAADGIAGPYLAAQQAGAQNDYEQAARYYTQAVAGDPDNTVLMQNAVLNMVIADDFDGAVPVANRLKGLGTELQLAGLVLLADAVRDENYVEAMALLDTTEMRFNPLLAGLLRGWVSAGLGETIAAAESFDNLSAETSFTALGQYHKALVFALAGNFDGAIEIFEGSGDGPLRVNQASILAHVQSLMQVDRRDDALAVLQEAMTLGRSRELVALSDKIEAGEDVEFTYVTSPRDGAAEVFLTLATALEQEQADRFALLYARLAQAVRPGYVDALILSADIFEEQRQYDLSIRDYERVPKSSSLYRSSEIGRANVLASSGQADASISALTDLSEVFPEDRFVLIALGDMLRREERYDRAADSYTRALALIETPGPQDWRTYYVRGIANERLDLWDQAEADFRQSLELSPDQPLVLNYLGYSLVEKRMKIEEAKDMIERAVAARPDDGYITDSLGWVLYRLGQYEDAVPHMERAVELTPNDPIINDHLGDVLWKVGRQTEAVFQWKRALSFEPEDEDAMRIRKKLDVGLDAVLADEGEESQ